MQREPVEDPAERQLRRADGLGARDLPGDRSSQCADALHELASGVGGVERRVDLITLGGQVVDGERCRLRVTLRHRGQPTPRLVAAHLLDEALSVLAWNGARRAKQSQTAPR